jgi:hypothetical protein
MRSAAPVLLLLIAAGTCTAHDQAAPVDPAAPAPSDIAKAPADQSALDKPAPKVSWPEMEDPGQWTVQIQPRTWYVSPSGKIRLPSSTTPGARVDVADLNLDSPRLEPYAEASIRFGKWRIGLGGFNNSLDKGTGAPFDFRLGDVAVTTGDRVNTSFDFTGLQAVVGYRFYDYAFCQDIGDGGQKVCAALRLEAFGGGRYYDIDIAFTDGTTTSQAERTFGEFILGIHAELEIFRDFSVDLEVSAGGYGDSSNSVFSIDTLLGFTWRPVDGVGLQLGWRQLAYDLSNGEGAGEFEYSGRLAGLFLGLDIRF